MPGAVAIVIAAAKAITTTIAIRVAVAVAVQYVVGSSVARNQANKFEDAARANLRAQQLANLRDVQEVIRSAVAPINIIYGTAKVGGVLICWFTTGDVGQYHHWAQAVAYHRVDGISAWYVNDEQVTVDGNGWVTTAKYCRGGTTPLIRVRLYDGTQTTLDADLLTASNGGYKATDAGTGCAYIYTYFEADYDVFGNLGAPKISAVVRGKPLYDPRIGTTYFTDNADLAVRDYLLADYGLRCSGSEVNDDDAIAAANICDESVALASGSQARYTVNGVLRADANLKANLENLVDAMAGLAVWSQGMWRVRAGAYETPTGISIDADDVLEVEELIAYTPRRELFNTVTGTFVDPDNLYAEKQFPVVTNATYVAQDGGQTIERQLTMPLCNNAIRAQRMAKIEIERARQAVTITLLCKWTVYDLTPGDHVVVTIPRYGWAGKVFFVGSRSISPDGIRYVLRETAAAVWSWNYGEATTTDPAPNTNLPDPFTVAAPGVPAIVESLYQTSGSAGVKSRATITFTSVANYAYRQRLAWRPQGGTWQTLPDQTEATFVLDDLTPGVYEFKAATINQIGVVSPYSATTSKRLLGLTAPPAAVAGFSVTKSSGFALAEWARHDDLDVRMGGIICIRHSPLTTGALWENGVIVREFNGNAVSGDLPLMTGTYMAKARDSSNPPNWSADAVSFVATEGMVTGFTTVASSEQHPTFAGSKSNVAVLDSTLLLSGLATIGSMATPVSEWGKISSLGGISATGSYTFDAVLDHGSVATRRFEADIAVTSFDTGDTISARGLVSGWGSVAGQVINDCDATLYISTTDDDPAGSPAWGPWTPFFVGDFTCRAERFQLDLASGQPTHNIGISALRVDVKTPT